MKKILSLLLSATMLSSVIVLPTVTASAEETSVAQVVFEEDFNDGAKTFINQTTEGQKTAVNATEAFSRSGAKARLTYYDAYASNGASQLVETTADGALHFKSINKTAGEKGSLVTLHIIPSETAEDLRGKRVVIETKTKTSGNQEYAYLAMLSDNDARANAGTYLVSSRDHIVTPDANHWTKWNGLTSEQALKKELSEEQVGHNYYNKPTPGGTIISDGYHTIKTVIDLTGDGGANNPDTYRVYVDGYLIGTYARGYGSDKTVRGEAMYDYKPTGVKKNATDVQERQTKLEDKLASIIFGGKIPNSYAKGGTFEQWIDYVKVTAIDGDYKFTVTPDKADGSSIDPIEDTLKFTFSGQVSTEGKADVKLVTENGQEVANTQYQWSENDKVLTIIPGTMEKLTKYKVVFGPAVADTYGIPLKSKYSPYGAYYGATDENGLKSPETTFTYTTVDMCNITYTPANLSNYMQGDDQEVTFAFDAPVTIKDGITDINDVFTVKDSTGRVVNDTPESKLTGALSADKMSITLNLSDLVLGKGTHTIANKPGTMRGEKSVAISYTFSVLDYLLSSENVSNYVMNTDEKMLIISSVDFDSSVRDTDVSDLIEVTDENDDVVSGVTGTVDFDMNMIILNLSTLELGPGVHKVKAKPALKDKVGRVYEDIIATISQKAPTMTYTSEMNEYEKGTDATIDFKLSIPVKESEIETLANKFTVKNEFGMTVSGIKSVTASEDGKTLTLTFNITDITGEKFTITSSDILAKNSAPYETEISINVNTEKAVEVDPDNGVADGSVGNMEGAVDGQLQLVDEDFESYDLAVDWLKNGYDRDKWEIVDGNRGVNQSLAVAIDPMDNTLQNKVLKVKVGTRKADGSLVQTYTSEVFLALRRKPDIGNKDSIEFPDENNTTLVLETKILVSSEGSNLIPLNGGKSPGVGTAQSVGYWMFPYHKTRGMSYLNGLITSWDGNFRRNTTAPLWNGVGFGYDEWYDLKFVQYAQKQADGSYKKGYDSYYKKSADQSYKKAGGFQSGTVEDAFSGVFMRFIPNMLDEDTQPTIYYDDMTAYMYSNPSVSIDVAKENVPVDTQITVTASDDVGADGVESLIANTTLKTVTGEDVIYTTEPVDTKSFKIIPTYGLKYETDYVIEIEAGAAKLPGNAQTPAVSYSFKTESPTVAVDKDATTITYTGELGDTGELGEATTIGCVMKLTGNVEAGTEAVVATYDENGKLLGLDKKTLNADQTDVNFTFSTQTGTSYVKMYVGDGLANNTAVIDFNVKSVDAVKSIVNVSGTVKDNTNKLTENTNVTIMAVAENEDVNSSTLYAYAQAPVNPADGSFSADLGFGVTSGKYDFYVLYGQKNTKLTYAHVDANAAAAFVRQIKNNTIAKENLYSRICTNGNGLGFDATYYATNLKRQNILTNRVDKSRLYLSGSDNDAEVLASFSDLMAKVKAECESIEKLEAETYVSNIYGILEKANKDYAAGRLWEINFTAYNALSNKGKLNVQTTLMNTSSFANAEDVKAKFDAAVAASANLKDNETTTTPGYQGPSVIIKKPTAGVEVVYPSTPKVVFNDIANYTWAQTEIATLYEMGIISGVTDTEFRPAELVTREQFAKLVVMACNALDRKASCDFKDVSGDAWYRDYVASAVKAGLIEGNDDGTFGSGKYITRQDMAVIINRALKYKGVELTNQKTDFTDADSISDYAKDSVFLLAGAGIINGFDDGSFASFDNATRAQAAVLVYSLIGR